jgi:hypothetical protein
MELQTISYCSLFDCWSDFHGWRSHAAPCSYPSCNLRSLCSVHSVHSVLYVLLLTQSEDDCVGSIRHSVLVQLVYC